MRKIEGYICLVKDQTGSIVTEYMFGKRIDTSITFNHQNFQSNNLTTFSNLAEAQRAKRQLETRNDFGPQREVSLAIVKMFLMEEDSEVEFFKKKKRNLIVVMLDREAGITVLVGRFVDGKPGMHPLYGARLEYNGMKTISSFDYADFVASEIQRQAQCLSPIGTFHLKRL